MFSAVAPVMSSGACSASTIFCSSASLLMDPTFEIVVRRLAVWIKMDWLPFTPVFECLGVGSSFLKDSPICHGSMYLKPHEAWTAKWTCLFQFVILFLFLHPVSWTCDWKCPHTTQAFVFGDAWGSPAHTSYTNLGKSWLNGFWVLKVYIQVSIFSRLWMTSINLDFPSFWLICHLVLRHVYEERREI